MDSSGNDQVDKPTSEEVNEPTPTEPLGSESQAPVGAEPTPTEPLGSARSAIPMPPVVDAFEPAQASTFEPLPEPEPVPGTLLDKAVPVERGMLEHLVSGTFHDPHQILGPHLGDGAVTLRVLRPFASTVTAVYRRQQRRAAARVRRDLGRRHRPRQGA